MYRYKRSIPLDYNQQGYIYFKSLMFNRLPQKERGRIIGICHRAGGDYWQAVKAYVTTGQSGELISQEHYISMSTLYRCVKKYYLIAAKEL